MKAVQITLVVTGNTTSKARMLVMMLGPPTSGAVHVGTRARPMLATQANAALITRFVPAVPTRP
jgi:hypothetical protein